MIHKPKCYPLTGHLPQTVRHLEEFQFDFSLFRYASSRLHNIIVKCPEVHESQATVRFETNFSTTTGEFGAVSDRPKLQLPIGLFYIVKMLETSLGEANCSNYVTNFPYPSLTSIPLFMYFLSLCNISPCCITSFIRCPRRACVSMIVYSAVSTPLDRSKRFTRYSQQSCSFLLTYLLLTPTRHIWEALGHAEITGRRLFIHISTTVNILISLNFYRGPTAMSTGVRWRERKFSLFETATKGI